MKQKQTALDLETRQFGERSPFDSVQSHSNSASSHKNEARFKLTARPDSMQFDLEAPKAGRKDQTIDAELEIKGVGTETPSMFNKTIRGIHNVFSGWLGQDAKKANPAKRQEEASAVLGQTADRISDAHFNRKSSRTRPAQNSSNIGSKHLNDALKSRDDLQQRHTRAQQQSNMQKQQNRTPNADFLLLNATARTDSINRNSNGSLSQQFGSTAPTPNGIEVNFDAKPDSIQFDLETSRSMNGIQAPVDINLDIQGIGTRNPQAFEGTFREINNLVANMLDSNPQNTGSGNSPTLLPGTGVAQPNQPNLQPNPEAGVSELKGSPLGASETITTVNDPLIVKKAEPLIGVIDSDFSPNQHGAQVRDVIAKTNPNAEFKLAEGVGQGKWAENLSQFVETAKASVRPAVANLSFDLSNVNPDGSIVTRKELTPDESQALAAAQKAGIPVVVSAGNQGESSHAWEQAAKQFDNVIVTGASDGKKQASYSSYGEGLDVLALGQKSGTSLAGTSLAAAETTATVANMLSVNPDLKAPEVEKILKATATDLDLLSAFENPRAKVKPGAGSDSKHSSDLINPAAAFTQAAALEKMEAEITAKTGVPDQQISVKAVDVGSFPNPMFGKPEPGQIYTAAMIPGYDITLRTPQKNYRYKADLQGQFEQIGAQSQKQSARPNVGGSAPLPQPKPQEPNQAISAEKPQKPDPVEPPKGGSSDPKKAMLEAAKSYVGTREQGGDNRGADVEKIQRSAGGKPGDAWCMEFVQHVVKDIETKTGARSNIKRSNRCRDVWAQTPKENRLARPEPGSLVIWKNHVGIVESVSADGKSFKTIEGNTTNPKNKSEQGVFEKDRKLGSLEPDNPLLGFVKVF